MLHEFVYKNYRAEWSDEVAASVRSAYGLDIQEQVVAAIDAFVANGTLHAAGVAPGVDRVASFDGNVIHLSFVRPNVTV